MTTETQPLRGPLRKRDSHLWARHPEDYYIEPYWVSDELFKAELFAGTVWDPACGSGRILMMATKHGYDIIATDLVDRGFPHTRVMDFRNSKGGHANGMELLCDIVSNPPFGIARAFAERALEIKPHKVALMLPVGWVLGQERSLWLEKTPLKAVYFICPRPSMPPGPVIEAGVSPGNGTSDFAWYVWETGHMSPPEVRWIRRPTKGAE